MNKNTKQNKKEKKEQKEYKKSSENNTAKKTIVREEKPAAEKSITEVQMSGSKKSKKLTMAAVVVVILAICFPTFGKQFFGSAESNGSKVESNQSAVTVNGFRDEKRLQEHFEKHGVDMGFATAKEYEEAAIKAATNPDALHKLEEEDGDDVYYVEKTNEFVIVSTDGYIRTYYNPSDGMDYFNRQ